jgi:hypothetical protein
MDKMICHSAKNGWCRLPTCKHAVPHKLDMKTCVGTSLCDHSDEVMTVTCCPVVEVKICNGCRQEKLCDS